MSTTDRVLAVIDAGLQHSDEASYGTDVHPDRCARCQRHELVDGDLCTGCRAFLLDDTAMDPRRGMTPDEAAALIQGMAEAVLHMVQRFQAAFAAFVEQTGKTAAELEQLIDSFKAEVEEPRSRRRERQLLGERRRSHRRTNRWGPRPGR